jgi:hypothetical protein
VARPAKKRGVQGAPGIRILWKIALNLCSGAPFCRFSRYRVKLVAYLGARDAGRAAGAAL